MIISAKVISTTQDKTGLTELKLVTQDINDNIVWVGSLVKVKKPDYEVKEIKEDF